MEGSQGYLLLKLGASIHISGVSFQLGRAVKDNSSAPRLVSISTEPYVEPLLNITIPRRASEVVTFMLPQPTSTTHSLVKIEVCFALELAHAACYLTFIWFCLLRSWTTEGIPPTPACIE